MYLSLFGQGIIFSNGSWESISENAKEQEKFIFVEVYGPWCAACKKLEKEVFFLPEIAAFYNQNFVNYRYNGDLSKHQSLNNAWDIKVYPSLLIVDWEGNLISKRTGFQQPLTFLEFGSTMIDYEKERKVLDKNLNSAALRAFLLKYMKISEVSKNYYLEQYFADIPSIEPTDKAMVSILNSSVAKASPYLMERLLLYYFKNQTHDNSEAIISSIDKRLRELSLSSNDVQLFNKYYNYRIDLCTFYVDDYPTDLEEIEIQFQDDLLHLYNQKKSVFDYFQLAQGLYKQRYEKVTATEINRKDGFLNEKITPNNPRRMANQSSKYLHKISLFIYRHSEDKSQLRQALKWSLKANSILPSAKGNLISAGIYNKLGYHNEANTQVKEARERKDFPEQLIMFDNLISAYTKN